MSAVAVLSLFASMPAQAHYLWSENTAKGNLIYFGGVDENVRETSPGRLDEFANLTGKIQHQNGVIVERSLKKTHDGFASVLAISATESLIGQDLQIPVKDLSAYKLGVLKLNFYVRHVQIDRAFPAALDLDGVPTGTPNQLKFTFKGAPLAQFKAKLIAPNGWISEIRTDDAGLLTIATPWRGNYVVEATYFEDISGDFQGLHYQRIRHRLGLTVVQPKGSKTFTPDYASHEHAD
ncbi:hypothetical protein [Herbaspirillum rhizosphaerae]|uniref:hypothetical protein n=1 Tax=Herbaspirillum rhizosphaerae TaxID=346179 RepID=UPI00067D69E3|nr:hypothetical protein [Herbaspirillum rhizosphaerae]